MLRNVRMHALRVAVSVALATVVGSMASARDDSPQAYDKGDRAAVVEGREQRAVEGFALPGGTLDPLSIPKFVTPLVIPPVMKQDDDSDDDSDAYDIAVRQFKQQILPGGIWNSLTGRKDRFPATPVWSYGPKQDPTPAVAPDSRSQFNYPAYTIETITSREVDVRWRNELVKDPDDCDFRRPTSDDDCDYLRHLLPVDQTLHWANPRQDCEVGPGRTDCAGDNPDPYRGPVPIVVHVHGSHVEGHSDGYPEGWWLPAAGNIPSSYAKHGRLFDSATGRDTASRGYADFEYRNDQPATTLWFHDHSLGMTRLNVYAGPAGFWLIRGGKHDRVFKPNGDEARLPGPAPVAGQSVLALNTPGSSVRGQIREIPIVIQDRSFNADGTLFYPNNRAFFEGLNVEGTADSSKAQFPGEPELQIPFAPDSDIAPIWNPEAFFNTMVVNGTTWPKLEVAPARYRFRLLNGCDSRFLNLALLYRTSKGQTGEIPFVQIGAEQGFLPYPVEILTGFATPILNATKPGTRVPASDPQQALLLGLAERADVIVDFGELPNGTVITMVNTAPDAPFGGFPTEPADPATTGQVMQFVVDKRLLRDSDSRPTDPYKLLPAAERPLGSPVRTRQVSLNEGASEELCVDVDAEGNLVVVPGSPVTGCLLGGEAFAPKEALLGLVDGASGEGVPLLWADTTGNSAPVPVRLQDGSTVKVNVSENPTRGDTEEWEMYNFTQDAHPIHIHQVRFEVVDRSPIPGFEAVSSIIQPWESGYKDTVIAYPGEITTVRAKFDIAGLYVWHCHILEHEDNEMMRPFVVSKAK